MSWWKKVYQNNKAIVWAAVVGIVLTIGILVKVPDEVTRFTLIMPIFAGFILFSILISGDDELGEEENEDKVTKKPAKKTSKKRS